MPRKYRRTKGANLSPEAEARLWGFTFDAGSSPLLAGELEQLGFETEDELFAAAPDAWRRLGQLYLSLPDAFPNIRDRCPRAWWALATFGHPAESGRSTA